MKLEISCCLCNETFATEIEPPAGWGHRYGEVGDEGGFCPKHAAVAAFAAHQCPGCVGSWGDCPLWTAFAYEHSRDLGPADFKKIEAGVCPCRVNGTISFRASRRGAEIEDLDLSERAPAEAGLALAQAIKDYWARYWREDTGAAR